VTAIRTVVRTTEVPATERPRVFIAAAPDPALRAALVACQQRLAARADLGGARLVDPADLHLTLYFIGALASSHLGALATAMRKVAARHAPCTLTPQALAGWPRDAARLLVVEFVACDVLSALVHDLMRETGRAGTQGDRRAFRPHVTLARSRTPLPARLVDACDADLPSMPVRDIVLLRSDARAIGPRYSPLDRVALSG
jgi:RNA 2',3'-cyclic 3'-phosphodiesterase